MSQNPWKEVFQRKQEEKEEHSKGKHEFGGRKIYSI